MIIEYINTFLSTFILFKKTLLDVFLPGLDVIITTAVDTFSNGVALDLCKNYLYNRKQYVEVGYFKSKKQR